MIPISAQLKYNIEVVCEYITKNIPVPLRDFTSEPRLIGEGRGRGGRELRRRKCTHTRKAGKEVRARDGNSV